MVLFDGAKGLSPVNSSAAEQISTPPWDVIKNGLETYFRDKTEKTMFDITLGHDPNGALESMVDSGLLIEDEEPIYKIYEIIEKGTSRVGVIGAAEVADTLEGKVLVHENIFKEKLKSRIKLFQKIDYSPEPVFTFVKKEVGLTGLLRQIISETGPPAYSFTSNFSFNGQPLSDLHGVQHIVYIVPQNSEEGRLIKERVMSKSIYIADGHHRYRSAEEEGHEKFLTYITDNPKILAYDRLINGNRIFEDIIGELLKDGLEVRKVEKNQFTTPEQKGECRVYTKEGVYVVNFPSQDNANAIESLDATRFVRHFYSPLNLNETVIEDEAHFFYLPENFIGEMQKKVDLRVYNMAIAFASPSPLTVIQVADEYYTYHRNNGTINENGGMPQKVTYFYPKPLSGLQLHKIEFKKAA